MTVRFAGNKFIFGLFVKFILTAWDTGYKQNGRNSQLANNIWRKSIVQLWQ